MKWNRIASAFALLLTAAAAPLPVFAQFEGEADFKITTHRDKGGPLEATARMYSSKSGFRMEYVMPMASTKRP